MKLSKIQELQFEILTEHLQWFENVEFHNINPFYKSTTENIKTNIEKAKKVYRDIFNFQFIQSYFAIYKKCFPYYEEMKELKI